MMLLSRVSYLFFIIVFISTSAHADQGYRISLLTAQEIERVRTLKDLLDGVDGKSVSATIRELEKSKHPLVNLEMKEAMAHAYVDIVKEIDVRERSKKEWLYSMICLNMAYLQFGGTKGKPGSTSELNRLIRIKLIQYLPPNVSQQSGFLYSLQ